LFWEAVGVVSYLLIGFEYNKIAKSQASKKVFIINRIGDTAFLGAIIICSYFMYSYAPNKAFATLSLIDMNTISTLVYAYTSTPLFWLICLMFLLAALIKSAQFPFYNWLQDAMEAKLPVSALLHSSTLVASGVYLTLRLLPFLTLESRFLNILIIFGFLTAILCSISAAVVFF
jgi:NADH-quinone oxidoreductase subunit L